MMEIWSLLKRTLSSSNCMSGQEKFASTYAHALMTPSFSCNIKSTSKVLSFLKKLFQRCWNFCILSHFLNDGKFESNSHFIIINSKITKLVINQFEHIIRYGCCFLHDNFHRFFIGRRCIHNFILKIGSDTENRTPVYGMRTRCPDH